MTKMMMSNKKREKINECLAIFQSYKIIREF